MLKKLFYITASRMPTEKARGYQIAMMCSEFAKTGLNISLHVPWFANPVKENLFSFYSIKSDFKIKKYLVIDLKFLNKIWPRFAYFVKQVSFINSIGLIFLFKSRKNSVVFTREVLIAYCLKKLGYKIIFEAHFVPGSFTKSYFKMAQWADKIIANSKGTAEEFIKQGFKNVLTCPNGVNLESFNLKQTKEELRQELKLPLEKKIVTYVGHFYGWKGMGIILEAADVLKGSDQIVFNLIGGTVEGISKLKAEINSKGLDNVHILGFKRSAEIPSYLKASDLLLLTLNPNSTEAKLYTSPIKLFEYLASKVPTLAPNLPSIKNLISKKQAVFYQAGSSADLLAKINENLNKDNSQLTEQAYQFIQNYSWPKRAAKILNFINCE